MERGTNLSDASWAVGKQKQSSTTLLAFLLAVLRESVGNRPWGAGPVAWSATDQAAGRGLGRGWCPGTLYIGWGQLNGWASKSWTGHNTRLYPSRSIKSWTKWSVLVCELDVWVPVQGFAAPPGAHSTCQRGLAHLLFQLQLRVELLLQLYETWSAFFLVFPVEDIAVNQGRGVGQGRRGCTY